VSAEQEGRPFTVSSRSAREAVRAVAERFVEFGEEIVSEDPLDWPGYEEQLARAREKSGEREAAIVGEARIGETPVVIIAFDFSFLGGSMGEAVGGKIVEAFARARESRRAVVSLVATGGARMQEGMRSLVQLQRIASACARARAEGIPHVSVLRNPTTGGVWISLAASADFLIGVKGATASFAGPRVREEDEGGDAFASAGKLRRGFIDLELEAEDVPGRLATVVSLLSPAGRVGPKAPPDLPAALGRPEPPEEAWDSVERARSSERPHATAYLDDYFEERVGISGDRVSGVDKNILCGFGRREGRTIAYAAQRGAGNSAAGFRTAKRLLDLAERLRLPVLTLIDTPGAGNEEKDEQDGIGTAIAELLCTMASLSVPVASLVIGEGGSGGALALASPENLWITPDAYFAVIAPESAAAILEDDTSQAKVVSEDMQLMPQDLVRLGIVRGVVHPGP
jgi:acetyl-CoA carboxylase carboxyl transferase subunit beta